MLTNRSKVISKKTLGISSFLVIILFAILAVFFFYPSEDSNSNSYGEWDKQVSKIENLMSDLVKNYQVGNSDRVNNDKYKAKSEEYQGSGFQSHVLERLGKDREKVVSDAFTSLKNATEENKPIGEVKSKAEFIVKEIKKQAADLKNAKPLDIRWEKKAKDLIQVLNQGSKAYQDGDSKKAFSLINKAYLGHYESEGIESASIALLSSGRVPQVEAQFRDIKIAISKGKPVSEVNQMIKTLANMVTEDCKKLSGPSSNEPLGWFGFFGAFTVLLREGVEALLVVAAVITYLVKAKRRDQLKGVYLGVVAGVAVSIGLAFLFSLLSQSVSKGMGQELLEGITGVLAVIMLIYVGSWILQKAQGRAWEKYIDRQVKEKSSTGNAFALIFVVFLAVVREGAETILFYVPIFGATRTVSDKFLVWAGLVSATAVLVLLFALVRVFGVRLPIKPFFKVTTVLLALLSVTIAGGAVKEFQDATLISAHPVTGVPTIPWLGLYPHWESLIVQLFVVTIWVIIAIMQTRVFSRNKLVSKQKETIK